MPQIRNKLNKRDYDKCMLFMVNQSIHPSRVALWKNLYKYTLEAPHKKWKTSELAKALGLSENTMWQKLSYLTQMGLLETSGTRNRYSIKMLIPKARSRIDNISEPTNSKPYRTKSKKSDKKYPGLLPPSSSHKATPFRGSRGEGKSKAKSKHSSAGKNKFGQMAELLCKTIQEKWGYIYWRKLADFEKQFYAIHSEDGVNTSELEETLVWYCDQIIKGNEDLPQCCTANMFRGAFGWIRDKMNQAPLRGFSVLDQQWLSYAEGLINESSLSEIPVDVQIMAQLLQLIGGFQNYALTRTNQSSEMSHVYHNANIRLDVLYSILNTQAEGVDLSGLYFEYIRNWHFRYPKWEGKLKRFMPMRDLFVKFLQSRAHDLTSCWLNDTELNWIKKAISETTENR